jgi:hypothetical protein
MAKSTKRAAKKPAQTTKTTAFKKAKKAKKVLLKNRSWSVYCKTERKFKGKFTNYQDAQAERKKHAETFGHKTTIIGEQ